MSALFSLLVQAPEAYLHSPLALPMELLVVFLLSYRLCTEFYLFSFQPISTASSSGILLPHPGLSETLPNPYYFLQNWNITENACSSYTIGKMMLYKNK